MLLLVALPGPAADELPLRARSRFSIGPLRPARRAFPIGKPIKIPTPLGLPPVPIPPDNPPTEETVALGHRLFYDKILSRDNTKACASCHDPKTGLADSRRVSLGVNDAEGNRNSMTVLNVAYNPFQFWDGRAFSLEDQATMPVADPAEMAHSLVGVERKLMANPKYVALFEKAWGAGPITYDMVAKSIASYERTLVSGNSKFDRYFYGGDKTAMNESAIRGLKFFLNPSLKAANCISCHRIDTEHATFNEARFHNTGVAWDPVKSELKDVGRVAIDGNDRLSGAFKTATLRNIALTAPYMHDGSMKTLEEVVDFYFDGGRVNGHISNDMPRGGLPDIPKAEQAQAKKDLVEFMKALTGELPANMWPPKE